MDKLNLNNLFTRRTIVFRVLFRNEQLKFSFSVGTGTSIPDPNEGALHEIEKIIIHRDYDIILKYKYDADIALVKVSLKNNLILGLLLLLYLLLVAKIKNGPGCTPKRIQGW